MLRTKLTSWLWENDHISKDTALIVASNIVEGIRNRKALRMSSFTEVKETISSIFHSFVGLLFIYILIKCC
jgi:hypothetical protein